ncbi:hypothetical protein AcW2_005752 [Taiwanofungus camphoratus]|nr:hypothetical protein AcW2_005752 [Antrodia cinnamomea]
MSSPKIWFSQVTGSSSGLGRLMAEYVLKNGDFVVATLRKPEVLKDLSSQYPLDKLLVVKLDVCKPQEIVDAFIEAREAFERIDVQQRRANFWGAANISREAVKFFREANEPSGGRLLQMSSVNGISVYPLLGFYNAAKSALEGFSETLAAELDPDWNIKITLVKPGRFKTRIGDNAVVQAPHPAYMKPGTVPVVTRQHMLSDSIYIGSAEKATQAIYRLALLPDPPLHFPLGMDCLAIVRRKTQSLLADIGQYESWSEGMERDTE